MPEFKTSWSGLLTPRQRFGANRTPRRGKAGASPRILVRAGHRKHHSGQDRAATTFNLRTLYRKMLRIEGVDSRPLTATASAAILTELAPFFQSGQFKVTAVESRALEDAPAAYAEAAQGGCRVALRAE